MLAAAHLGEAVAPATLLVGHSLGGAAVLAAAKLPEVAAVATIAAPADPAHVAARPVAGDRRQVPGAPDVAAG